MSAEGAVVPPEPATLRLAQPNAPGDKAGGDAASPMSLASSMASDATMNSDANPLQDASEVKTLTTMPPEILDLIALYTATDEQAEEAASASSSASASSASPLPSTLASLLITCSRIHSHLCMDSNPRLYARIFRSKFDVAAIGRRYGPESVSSRALANELQRRCVILKRIKRAVAADQLRPEGPGELGDANMNSNLWLALLMLTENDGRNMAALQWAEIKGYVSLHHVQEMLESTIQPGYPPESEDRALALYIGYLTSDRAEVALGDRDEAEEKLFVLRPFVFASHKFESLCAPWTIRHLPLPPAGQPSAALTVPGDSSNGTGRSFLQRNDAAAAATPATATTSSSASQPVNPFLADLAPRVKATTVYHCGQLLSIRPPVLSHAAILNFFMQVEKDPAVVGLQAITERGAEPGTAPVAPNADGGESSSSRPAARQTQLGLLHPSLGAGTNGTECNVTDRGPNSGPLALRSLDHDSDVARLLACYDPYSSAGLPVGHFSGMFKGAWEGRFSFFDFDSYRDMLAGRMRSLYEGPFGEQPQVWKLNEHYVRVGEGTGRVVGGEGLVTHAGFTDAQVFEDTTKLPKTLEEAKDLARGQGTNGNKRTVDAGSSSGRSRNKKRRPEVSDPSSSTSKQESSPHLSARPADYHLYPQFDEQDGGAAAAQGHRRSDSSDDSDADDTEDNSSYEMLLSGMGHSAWGRFVLRGRVRAWDGMVILSKEYRPDGRGRWLYRGYVTAGGTLVGRWRDSFTPADMSGYEGPFVLNRRSNGNDEA